MWAHRYSARAWPWWPLWPHEGANKYLAASLDGQFTRECVWLGPFKACVSFRVQKWKGVWASVKLAASSTSNQGSVVVSDILGCWSWASRGTKVTRGGNFLRQLRHQISGDVSPCRKHRLNKHTHFRWGPLIPALSSAFCLSKKNRAPGLKK